jgi:hypothetical protein
LNGLNVGLAYALEALDFENFHGMVNRVLVLENCRGMLGCKRKLVRPLLLGIRVFRGLKLLRTHYRVNGSATLAGSELTFPTNAPICATALLR